MDHGAKQAIMQIRQGLNQFGYRMRSFSGSWIKAKETQSVPYVPFMCISVAFISFLFQDNDLKSILSRMTFQDFNRTLFRCHEEEVEEGKGFGAYHVPKIGSFIYCGLTSKIFC